MRSGRERSVCRFMYLIILAGDRLNVPPGSSAILLRQSIPINQNVLLVCKSGICHIPVEINENSVLISIGCPMPKIKLKQMTSRLVIVSMTKPTQFADNKDDIRLLCALYPAGIGKGTRKQLFDAIILWPPVLEMAERLAVT